MWNFLKLNPIMSSCSNSSNYNKTNNKDQPGRPGVVRLSLRPFGWVKSGFVAVFVPAIISPCPPPWCRVLPRPPLPGRPPLPQRQVRPPGWYRKRSSIRADWTKSMKPCKPLRGCIGMPNGPWHPVPVCPNDFGPSFEPDKRTSMKHHHNHSNKTNHNTKEPTSNTTTTKNDNNVSFNGPNRCGRNAPRLWEFLKMRTEACGLHRLLMPLDFPPIPLIEASFFGISHPSHMFWIIFFIRLFFFGRSILELALRLLMTPVPPKLYSYSRYD